MKFIYDRNKVAIVFKDKGYTYKELITNLKYYSTLLGINDGDRVVVTLENRPEMVISIFGIWEASGISTVLDSGYTPEQYAYAFNDSKPKYAIVSNKTIKNVSEGIKLSGLDIKMLNVDEITLPTSFVPNNYEVNIEDLTKTAIILYTSGTTGNPKGVMLTFGNLESNIRAIRDIHLVDDTDRVLALLPFHHVLPLNITLLMPMYFGTFLVILDEISSENLTRNLKEHKISVIMGVPRVWELLHKGIMGKIRKNKMATRMFNLCEKINSLGFSKKVFKKVSDGLGGNMRVMASGGAKLNPDIIKDFRTLGLEIIEGYGLTETSPLISFNRPENIVPGSAGKVIPDVEVKIAEDGEILVRGANVMKGYYKNPEATAKAIDKDNFFHTGDLGEFKDGSLYIVGRKKEMIVLSNGKNINPGDIESLILRQTDLIKEMAVMEYNKHLMAIVYPDFDVIRRKKISNIKETLKWEIIDKYNIDAPKYKKILEIKVVSEELPKTKIGKIRRFMLPDFLKSLETHEGGNEEVKKPKIVVPDEVKTEYETLAKYLEENYNEKVEPNFHLELDLGIDSLDIVEILAFIENHFGVKISEEKFSEFKNILEIATYIHDKGGKFNEEGKDNWQEILSEDVDIPLPKSSFYSKFSKYLFKPLFFFYLKLQKRDLDNIPDRPAIYVGNHQSFMDALMFNQCMSNKKLNDTYYIAVATHFEGGFKRYIANHSNIILIDINKNLLDTIKIAGKVLRNNKNLVIFPEGARTRDGNLQEFKKTFAILAHELDIDVVPFGINGAYDSMPYGSKFPKAKTVEIKFFEPIEAQNRSVEEIKDITRNTIKDYLKHYKI